MLGSVSTNGVATDVEDRDEQEGGLGAHPPQPAPENTFPMPYGRYVLLDKIGEGGMAEVFRAAVLGPAKFQRILVVKRILPHVSREQSFVQMFIDEANLCARLSHPNIVQIYEFGKALDSYFIAMEHVHGRNVNSVMSRLARDNHRLLPPVAAANIAHQVCLGLDYAHTLVANGRPLGIIHRDVSPTNIMVAYTGTVKVLDFGIARAAEGRETNTQVGTLKGKVSYLAPEQIQLGAIDHRVDIFALGIVLHEMLTGRRLIKAQTDMQRMKMILEMPIPRPSAANPGVRPKLEHIVMHALERNPDRRYSSAAEMASDLESYLIDERHSTKDLPQLLRSLFEEEISRTPAVEISTEKLAEVLLSAEGSRPQPVPDGQDRQTNKPAAVGDPMPSDGSHRSQSKNMNMKPLLATTSQGSDESVIEINWVPEGRSFAGKVPNKLVVAAGLVGLALALVIAIPRLTSRPQAPRTETVAATRSQIDHPRSASPEPSPRVQISFDSVPQDATVVRSDRPNEVLGLTPVAVNVLRGTEAVGFIITKAGYMAATVKILPDLNKPMLVTLKPLHPSRSKLVLAKKNVAHEPESPSAQPTGEKIRKAIPVNPFAD
jgi:serine/threonine protein kinase